MSQDDPDRARHGARDLPWRLPVRGSLVAALVLAALAVAPAASAETLDPGGNLADLETGLASCPGTPATPYAVDLTTDLLDTSTELVVSCDARIDLAGHDLTVRDVVVTSGQSLEVTDSTAGAGTLTADASSSGDTAGIETTDATLTTSGSAQVIATGGAAAAGIGGTTSGAGGTVTAKDTSTITATGGPHAAGIGGGDLGAGGTTASIDNSTITATGGQDAAGIGGGRSGPGGDTTGSNTSTITATGGDNAAGIGGGDGGNGGTTTSNGTAAITANGGQSGAGIGGGNGGNGGTTTGDNASSITATGGDNAAGIGGGDSGGDGSTTTSNDTASITATGGSDAAGIGGGNGGNGASTTSNNTSAITATGGSNAAGIGGGNNGNGGDTTSDNTSTITATGGDNAAGIGGGNAGASGITTANNTSTITATGGSGGSAVGVGSGGTPTGGTFLQVNGGSVLLGSDLRVPDAAGSPEVTIGDGALIARSTPAGTAAITGDGLIENNGAITLPTDAVDPTLVTGHHFGVTFDTQGGSTAPDPVTVFADTFVHGDRSLPADPTKPGLLFLGWNTQPDGTGDTIDEDSTLPNTSTDGTAAAVPLYAQYGSVSSLTDLRTALAHCTARLPNPLSVALTTDLSGADTRLLVRCDARIDLGGYDLGVQDVVIATGKSLEVTDSTAAAADAGTLTADASAADGTAGIQNTDATLTTSGTAKVVATGGDGAAGIGGGRHDSIGGAGGLTHATDDSQVTATGGRFGAGIGGGRGTTDTGGAGGTTATDGNAEVTATGGREGAGIGGGSGESHGGVGGTTTTDGHSQVTATGGLWAAGIGGGEGFYAGDGGTTTTKGFSQVTATGGASGAGIGGAYFHGAAGSTTIDEHSTVTATSTATGLEPGSAIGVGYIGEPDPGTFLTVTSGTLRLGSDLIVDDADADPATAEVSIGAAGVVARRTSPVSTAGITGDGTVDNGGAITLPTDAIDPTLVTAHHYRVTFDTQGGSAAPDPVTVFADSFTHGDRTMPADPTEHSHAFVGWNTAADGTGDTIDADSTLPGTSTDGTAVAVTLYAQFQQLARVSITSSAPTDAVVGGPAYDVTTEAGPSTGAVTVSASPSEVCTASGTSVTFVGVGTCTVTATQAADADIDEATDSQQFDVGKGAQAITFDSSAPSPAYPEDTYDVTTTGGAGTSSVTLSSGSPSVCTVSGSTVTFLTAGDCVVQADQAGDDNYEAAPQAVQHVSVTQVGSTVQVSPRAGVVTGESTTLTAQVTVDAGTAVGTVQFTVDGTDLGGPVAVDGSGAATSPEYAGGAGNHDLGATFTPTDAVRFAGSSDAGTLGIAQASTSTTVSVTATTLRADVAVVAPGAGTPGGEVRFYVDGSNVGTAPLVGGTATLTHTTPLGRHTVAAQYLGDADFAGSSDSTDRRDPGLVARTSSTSAMNARGWYRNPVTVRFTCTPHGSPLVGGCPTPVTLRRDGAGQSLTRTIRAEDGGIATTTVRVNLDRTGPRVRVSGVRSGGLYFTAPPARCTASDTTSGLAGRCTVRVQRHGAQATVTATATDRAGNRSTAQVTYRLALQTIEGAPYVHGAYQVRPGGTYTLRVTSTSRPTYVYPAPYPGTPHGGYVAFHQVGKNTWALGVTMDMSTSHTRTWYLGVLDHGHLIRIKVQLIG